MRVVLILSMLMGAAFAQTPEPPDRQIPAAVLASLVDLQNDFARALVQDCAEERCFSQGCTYASHSVVDQPASGSLPGLRLDTKGPGTGTTQMFLTTAICGFTHERSVSSKNARALAKRLEAKLSRGWTKVKVDYERLLPVSDAIRDTPDDYYDDDLDEVNEDDDAGIADAAVKPDVTPEEWGGDQAARELWTHLLPHFSWMIALVLGAIIALLLIWAVRKLGRQSPEEQLLLAQMLSEGGRTEETETDDASAAERAELEARFEKWRLRFAAHDGSDPALQALVSDLLRTGERRLLAKAALRFPDALIEAFPQTGSLASAKFQLAEYIKTVRPEQLPSDVVFLDALDRYALASSLTAHADTDLIRSLHDEFGPKALVDVSQRLPARYGALLFALAPDAMQHEAVGLIGAQQLAQITDALLRSNRMDSGEHAYLMDVLAALRRGEAYPAPPVSTEVSDRGQEFAATAALSVLLPRLDPEIRGALVGAAAGRLNGRLPEWLTTTMYGEMLLALPAEQRTDLMLAIDVHALSAWLRAQTPQAHSRLYDQAPAALRAAISSVPPPETTTDYHALVNDGRSQLSAEVQRLIMRGDVTLRALLA